LRDIFFKAYFFVLAFTHVCLWSTIIMCLENQALIKIVNPLQCWRMTNLKIGYLHMLCFFLVVALVTFALVSSFFSMILITPITIAYLMSCTTNWPNRGYSTKIQHRWFSRNHLHKPYISILLEFWLL